ncbi:MAG: hypothetical protein WCG02_03620 [Candidatus Taylorbacteria bacterium]
MKNNIRGLVIPLTIIAAVLLVSAGAIFFYKANISCLGCDVIEDPTTVATSTDITTPTTIIEDKITGDGVAYGLDGCVKETGPAEDIDYIISANHYADKSTEYIPIGNINNKYQGVKFYKIFRHISGGDGSWGEYIRFKGLYCSLYGHNEEQILSYNISTEQEALDYVIKKTMGHGIDVHTRGNKYGGICPTRTAAAIWNGDKTDEISRAEKIGSDKYLVTTIISEYVPCSTLYKLIVTVSRDGIISDRKSRMIEECDCGRVY